MRRGCLKTMFSALILRQLLSKIQKIIEIEENPQTTRG
jgi:hypothetical protein